MYKDREIKCFCGTMFIFSAQEQQDYIELGFLPPKRCIPCRIEKKRKNDMNNHAGYGHEESR